MDRKEWEKLRKRRKRKENCEIKLREIERMEGKERIGDKNRRNGVKGMEWRKKGLRNMRLRRERIWMRIKRGWLKIGWGMEEENGRRN